MKVTRLLKRKGNEMLCYILSCSYNTLSCDRVLVVRLCSPGAKALASMSSQSGFSAAFPLFISLCVVAMASVPLPFCDGNEQPTLNCFICFTMRGLLNSPSGLGCVYARWQRRHCEETVQLQYFRSAFQHVTHCLLPSILPSSETRFSKSSTAWQSFILALAVLLSRENGRKFLNVNVFLSPSACQRGLKSIRTRYTNMTNSW